MTDGNALPVATAAFETRTIIDPTSGAPITVVVVPDGTTGIAFMLDGDAYPRVQINVGGADNGVVVGDGTTPGTSLPVGSLNPLQPSTVTGSVGTTQKVQGGNSTDMGGGALYMYSGVGPTGSGPVFISSKPTTAADHDSGTFTLRTGNATGTGSSGLTQVESGSTVNGDSGDVQLHPGFAGGSGNAGDVAIVGGSAGGAGNGGDVYLQPGQSVGGTGGAIEIKDGDAHNVIQVGPSDNTLGLFGAAPTAQHAAIADATGGATIDTQARSALNTLLAYLRLRGDIAT